MRRLFFGIVTLGVVTLAASTVAAQPPPPPPITNLKIYPKDIARPELITTMQGFVRQLGVQTQGGCGYCHAGTAPQFDFASDANPKKDVARRMILMSREITGKLPDVPAKPPPRIPPLPPPPPPPAIPLPHP